MGLNLNDEKDLLKFYRLEYILFRRYTDILIEIFSTESEYIPLN